MSVGDAPMVAALVTVMLRRSPDATEKEFVVSMTTVVDVEATVTVSVWLALFFRTV